MWSFVAICVLCFVISTDAANINVESSIYKNNITCHQNNEINITALEGDLLTFSVQSDETLNDNDFIGCNKIDETKLPLMSTTVQTISLNKSFTITKDMGGRWRCTRSSSSDGCLMKLHVRLKDSPIKVLQHNMVIKTDLSDSDEKYDHFGRAFYTDEDDLNITCIVEDNSPVTPNLNIEYKCPGQQTGVNQGRPIPGNATKDRYVVCTYKYQNDFTKTKVIFVPYSHDNYGYIKVNGHIARQNWTRSNGFGSKMYELKYIFSNKDRINVSCHTEIKGLVARSKCAQTSENNNTYEKEVSILPIINIFNCSICNRGDSENKTFTVNITKLVTVVSDSTKSSVIATTNPSESTNNGNANTIICSVIAALLVIGMIIYGVNMWKQKSKTAQHTNEGIAQTGDQQNSVYAEPYDHKLNYIRQNVYSEPHRTNPSTTSPTDATSHTNSRNAGIIQRQVDYCYSNYIDQPNHEDYYAEATPKNIRLQNINTTGPKAGFPTESETPQYVNEGELGAGTDEDLYVNEEEAVLGEDLYVNEKTIGQDAYDNVRQEPFYGNNACSLNDEPTYSMPLKKTKN